jgi:hypothetical protein
MIRRSRSYSASTIAAVRWKRSPSNRRSGRRRAGYAFAWRYSGSGGGAPADVGLRRRADAGDEPTHPNYLLPRGTRAGRAAPKCEPSRESPSTVAGTDALLRETSRGGEPWARGSPPASRAVKRAITILSRVPLHDALRA